MAKLVEISGWIENGMWDYHQLDLNGAILSPVDIRRAASITQPGFGAHELHFNTLTGSYLETAAHLVDGEPTIEQIQIDDLIRPARLLRLLDKSPVSIIRVKELVEHDPHLQPNEALIIQTGWGRHWNQPDYVTSAPRFELACLDWLLG